MVEEVESRIYEHEGVNKALDKIEEEYDVTVLSARDFGSTAWNLDSEESDRDVAFVFKQPLKNYAQLGKTRENIDRDFEFNDKEHTFMGWNLKKFMKLLDDSNPTVIEFLNSPIIYRERNDVLACMEDRSNAFVDLQIHANENFKPIALFYHYRSMAKSNFQKYIENENDLTMKRHLYVLRGIFYARYVEETHEFPPLNFPKFLTKNAPEIEAIPGDKISAAEKLVQHKKSGNGGRKFSSEELHRYMKKELEGKLDSEEHDIRGIDTKILNKTIERIYDE